MEYKSQNVVCQNCKGDFQIEPEDFNFYEKIKVPPPTWCFECRQIRRYAWRNERTLYRRNCDLCGKSTVTIYSPNKPHKVYCNECWWGDGWDASSYGRDFDFSRSFFEQFHELQLEVPRMALLNKRSVNSEYTNHSGDNKNVYLSFSSFFDENVYYSNWVFYSRDCMDCYYVREKGERLYECMDAIKSYQCQYNFLMRDCVNVYYSFDMHGCNDCFLSYNLRNRRYCFKNVEYSREEYLSKISEYDLSSYATREKLYKEFINMIKNLAVHKYMTGERNINCVGNMLTNSKNSSIVFDSGDLENTKYMFSTLKVKDSLDCYHVGLQCEQIYEAQGCTTVSNCQFCHLCYDNMNVMYGDTCQNSQNLFGCISIKKGEYMIFNKKYSKEEYLALKEKIIEHMKKTGEFGEFMPPSIAPVCYNETQGQRYNPMSREEILSKGWQWEDKIPGTYGKETIQSKNLPDKIKDVQMNITKEVLKCINCSKNYNIVPFELSFYQRENIPLPRLCSDCRYMRWFNLRPPRKLWQVKCKCDIVKHGHQSICSNEFKTSFAPDRTEKVYCEKCYQQEVY